MTNLESQRFEKVYVLDTNIILNDVTNIELLSQESSNLIVIPETVMDELDIKKTGFDEINFQARSFGRLLEKTTIVEVNEINGLSISRLHISNNNVTIDIISKTQYQYITEHTDRHILNDRKILEIAQDSKNIYNGIEVAFVSNDVMCRLRAISLNITTEVMGKHFEEEITLFKDIEIQDEDFPSYFEKTDVIPETAFGVCLINSKSDRRYYYKSGITFHLIDDEDLRRQNIKPLNPEQKIYSSLMLDPYYDIVVVDARAGTGKTALALSAAMRLIDKNRERFNKIVYMRKTVTVENEEMGFLPGTQEEKLSPYLAPLYSNLEAIVTSKYTKKLKKEELEEKISDLVKEYQITPMFEGFLRGSNIRDAIVIVDEIQNEAVSGARTIFTRVTEGCKVIAIGSNKQIDNKFINRNTSALTYLKNRLRQDNGDVRICATTLTKTVRSRIAEWADNFK